MTGRPVDPTAQDAIADIQTGKYAAAVQLLQQDLTKNPKDTELLNLLGIAYSELGKAHEAEQTFTRGLSIAPNSTSLNENEGLLFFRQARYREAKKRLALAIASGSTKATVRFSLAAAKLRTGEGDAALQDLRALQPELANVPDYWEERGRAELPRSASDAESSFEHALELNPNSVVSLDGAAAAAERQGLDEKALAYLIRARKIAPEDLETQLHFASICIRRDLGPDAIEAAEQARKLAPANLTALYLLARANISVQNWQRARDLFSELSRRCPEFAPAYYALGWIDIRLGHVVEARREIEHSLAIDPKLVDARYDLAQLEFDDGNIEKARALLTAVLQENPNYARANMTLGEIEMRAGHLDRARELLERAVAADPKLSAAHYKLATLYEREHANDKAARERTIASELSTDEKKAAKTQLRLVLPN